MTSLALFRASFYFNDVNSSGKIGGLQAYTSSSDTDAGVDFMGSRSSEQVNVMKYRRVGAWPKAPYD
jgi:hypothetical protein